MPIQLGLGSGVDQICRRRPSMRRTLRIAREVNRDQIQGVTSTVPSKWCTPTASPRFMRFRLRKIRIRCPVSRDVEVIDYVGVSASCKDVELKIAAGGARTADTQGDMDGRSESRCRVMGLGATGVHTEKAAPRVDAA